jgi:transposase
MAAAEALEERHPGGRPSKCTKELIGRVEETVGRLYYVEAVADSLGIGRKTFYEWLQRGEVENDSIYAQFAHTVKRAQAKAKEELLSGIRAGNAGDWQGKAWILERCYPAEFGRRERLEITGADGGPIEVEHIAKLSDDALQSIIDIMERGQITGEVVDITPDDQEKDS